MIGCVLRCIPRKSPRWTHFAASNDSIGIASELKGDTRVQSGLEPSGHSAMLVELCHVVTSRILVLLQLSAFYLHLTCHLLHRFTDTNTDTQDLGMQDGLFPGVSVCSSTGNEARAGGQHLILEMNSARGPENTTTGRNSLSCNMRVRMARQEERRFESVTLGLAQE